MPKRTKEEKAAAKAERAAKRQRQEAAAAAAGVEAAAASVEMLETVSLVELARLRTQPSVANAESDEEDSGGGGGEEPRDVSREDGATAARVALRRQKGEKLLKSGQHAKAFRSFEAALELQPENAELQLLVNTTRQNAPTKRKTPPAATMNDEGATRLDQRTEHAAGGSKQQEKQKKQKKQMQKKNKKTDSKSISSGVVDTVAQLRYAPDIGAIEERRAERGIVVVGPSVDGQPGPWCSVAPMAAFTDAAIADSNYRLSPGLISQLSRYEHPTAVQAQCV
eukprot:SAG31_NODE_12524_length_935_cov_1.047847_1_plen_280_part_10